MYSPEGMETAWTRSLVLGRDLVRMLWLRLDVEDRCRDGGCRMDGFWCGREQLLWLAIVDAIAASEWGMLGISSDHWTSKTIMSITSACPMTNSHPTKAITHMVTNLARHFFFNG